MARLHELVGKSSLVALWGTAIIGTAVYCFVTGQPVSPELGMAFGAFVGYVTGKSATSQK